MSDSQVMRVLVVAAFREKGVPSGEEVVARAHVALLQESSSIEVESCFIDYNPQASMLQRLKDLFWSKHSAQDLQKAIKAFQPDIVHVHSIFPQLSFSCLRLAHKLGVKTAVTFHNMRFMCSEGLYYYNGRSCKDCVSKTKLYGVFRRCVQGSLIKSFLFYVLQIVFISSGLCHRWVDRFYGVSSFTRDEHLSAFPPHKLGIIRNSVSKQVKQDNFHHKTLLFAGRLSRAKGFHVFVELARLCPQYHFIAVGSLEDGAVLPELSNFTYFPSMGHDDLLDLMRERISAVAVFSICSETFSLMTHEAFSFGLPVLGSSYGYLKTVLPESGGGISVDLDNLTDCVSAVTKLFEDQRAYDVFSEQGHLYIESMVSEDVIRHDYEEAYRQLLE